ncbi:hypothetical protein O0I10_006999 [Lichtheimia ornata]|uniref:Uncharacterized protein n=1 Tax=Lichtheimia ornata TaxID=688661 RepID=A0AAD7V0T5_9FUNG|nr:uncharacterized protein O0I10_006999 [Lichtheimia ornata]KAJ8657183.1 hypothetical protein O0I10_006999 [Lichtheimia ornata]
MPGNHGKKPSDRRDSLKQQQRKNNSTHKQKEPQANSINNSKSQPHRSNTPPASTATSSSSPPQPQPPLSSAGPQPALGQNGFNSADVMQFLNQRFSDTLAAYHDGSSGEGRPEKYESQEKAWGNKGGLPSVWGQKNGIMANGGDLLTELVKNS